MAKGSRAMKQNNRKRLLRSEEHTSELQSRQYLVCRLLLEKKKRIRPGTGGDHSAQGQTRACRASRTFWERRETQAYRSRQPVSADLRLHVGQRVLSCEGGR